MKKFPLSSESVRMVELGHPWIIEDRTTKSWGSISAGEAAELTDQNGKFLATALLDPSDRIVARIISREKRKIDRRFFEERIKEALSVRNAASLFNESEAFRIVNAEGDSLPAVTIDRYKDHLLIQLFSPIWNRHLDDLVSVLNAQLKPAGIYLKNRPRQTREIEAKCAGGSFGKLVSGKPALKRFPVKENGISYLVSLEEGLNTGLFLDQRENRKAFRESCRSKRVLNLFSHTGSFSVAAASGGASLVASVDVSQAYTEWAKDNFRQNGIDAESHEFIISDCMKALDRFAVKNRKFDIILSDPPSFSSTSRGKFNTLGGTAETVEKGCHLLEKGGRLIVSSNHQKVDIADFLKEIRKGSLKADAELRVAGIYGQPADFPYPVTFPEGRYLKYVVTVKV